MATVALVAYVLYLAVAFRLQTVLQLRRTGSSGFKGFSGRPGSVEWLAGVPFVVALAAGAAATNNHGLRTRRRLRAPVATVGRSDPLSALIIFTTCHSMLMISFEPVSA